MQYYHPYFTEMPEIFDWADGVIDLFARTGVIAGAHTIFRTEGLTGRFFHFITS